jgi:2-polyprenyl-6-methoxyphenol hydroxylase-like FAD-dependent oxidoreductase
MASSSPILIVGAGTTGLAMACELARHGAPVRIIDKQSGINPHCRACSVHARTLEIFHDFGIVDEILAQGHKVLGMSQYASGVRFMHSSGGEIDSPYPYTVNLEQCKTELALERLLRTYDIEVEHETELVAISGRRDAVFATVHLP